MSTRFLPLLAALLLVALAAVGAWLLYRRELRLVRSRARVALVCLRLIVVGAVAVLVAEPILEESETVVEPGEALVIVDASESFSIVDRARPVRQVASELLALRSSPPEANDGLSSLASGASEAPLPPSVQSELDSALARTRRELALAALESGWLEGLGESYRVTLLALDGELAVVPHDRIEDFPKADGRTTDLADPVFRAVVQRGVDRVAGVVLFTDGRHHGSHDPRTTCRRLGGLGIPLVTVGVGPDDPPQDVVLSSVDLVGSVFAGDEVIAEAIVESTFAEAVTGSLRVVEEAGVLHEEQVRLEPGTSRLPVRFRLGDSGRRRIRFQLLDCPEEARQDNNDRAVWLDVPGRKARVLLLDGGPRWEWRFLRSAWERDQNVDLSAHLLTPAPDRRLPDEYPRSREGLYAFDVLLLGDVEPSVFSREERQLLQDFVVRRGGTLVLLAGERAMPYGWIDTPLADVFPVRLLRPEPTAQSQLDSGRAGWPLTLGKAGLASGLGRLVPGRERNLRLWESLPPPYWVAPVAGLRSGAEVVVHVSAAAASRIVGLSPGALRGQPAARLAERHAPVLVTRPHGAGRVLFLATDGTWRWRYQVGDKLYQRFWGQIARWAIEGDLVAGDASLRLGTQPAIVAAPGELRLEGLARNPDGSPREEAAMDVRIRRLSDGAEARQRLDPVPRSGGRYRARIAIGEIGQLVELGLSSTEDHVLQHDGLEEYEVTVQPGFAAEREEDSDLPRVRFAVAVEGSPEARDLRRDAALLTELSTLTGGTYLPLERFREAGKWLRDRSRTVEKTRERSPWNSPWLLAALLFAALCGEWWLRKRSDLV